MFVHTQLTVYMKAVLIYIIYSQSHSVKTGNIDLHDRKESHQLTEFLLHQRLSEGVQTAEWTCCVKEYQQTSNVTFNVNQSECLIGDYHTYLVMDSPWSVLR